MSRPGGKAASNGTNAVRQQTLIESSGNAGRGKETQPQNMAALLGVGQLPRIGEEERPTRGRGQLCTPG